MTIAYWVGGVLVAAVVLFVVGVPIAYWIAVRRRGGDLR